MSTPTLADIVRQIARSLRLQFRLLFPRRCLRCRRPLPRYLQRLRIHPHSPHLCPRCLQNRRYLSLLQNFRRQTYL